MTQATQIVHWPGKDTAMCDKHAAQARGIANAMGFALSCTPVPQFVEACAEHAVLLIDGRCPECKDTNGASFVLDMQSKVLMPVHATCKNCENEAKKHAERPTELP